MSTPTTAAAHRSRPRSLPLQLPLSALLAVLLVLPLLGGIAVAAARQDARPAVSPATGHASVIAQGLAILPPGDLAWRVTYRSSGDEPADAGKAGPGFVATEQGAVLAALDRDRWTLLLPGEAAFVEGGDRDVRAAAADPAAWFDLELVPAGRADADIGGIAVYAGSAFAAPAGEAPRDLGLVRDVLQPDETTTIAAQDAPTLVLATQGTLRVASDDGSSAELAVGQAGAFLGGLTIAGAGSAPSSFLAAVVGGPVELPGGGAAATPQAAGGVGGPGEIAVSVYGCPPDTRPRRATPDTCRSEPAAASLTLVALDGDAPRDLGAPEVRDGQPTWDGLPEGTYAIRPTGFGTGYDRLFVPGLEAVSGDGAAGIPAGDAGGYRIDLTGEAPSARLEAYALGSGGALPSEGAIRIAEPAGETTPTAEKTPRPDKTPDPEKTPKADRARQSDAAGTATPVTTEAVARPRRGSITVRVLTCPDPYATFDAARCVAAAEPFDVSLTGKDGDPLTLADARADGSGGWVWEDLPFDDYVLQQPLLAPGAATYYLPAGELLPDGTGYVLRIDADAPSLDVDLYGLAPESAPPTPAPAAPVAAEPTPAPAAPVEGAPPADQPPAAGIDTDGDSLTDDYEINVSGTDPNVWDSDGDGIGDGDEVLGAAPAPPPAEGGAPPASDAGAGQAPAGDADADGDGLTDAQEAEQGTSPAVADSDGDGASDGAEVNAGTSPRDSGDVPQA